ncbi:MAG: aspartate ammonia-lyase [Candidatus Omnitrophica bacterium]|jgi:aspartate ammonia-lyase|nr:aspartate ammonia-lyase [Candidatus Omnitrophota bacterium]MDD3274774.1 aspartate ammonia-lyase [Candidatus Omnitrophota bacterium]MDD5078374.1 aspartate ammonia-lyase [Candidatus Omnitrophota bacterium]MDD5725202.1 aspartate ammonia-lyase [Candidatus Omnitrophota bacterium]
MEYRIEEDALGQLKVPAGVYWGVHTARALENFPLSGQKVNSSLIKSYCLVKKACARANRELKLLDEKKADAVMRACDEVAEGRLADQFPVDPLQGGAGTSTNMNVNEVLANRAAEILGGSLGDYALVNPIEDVNLNQSTNDTYPTALKVAAIFKFRELSAQIAALQGALQKKEKEFASIVKVGRTEMQEAVPITLGQEFSAFAEAVARDRWRVFKCEERLRIVNLGGTAVGTGLTAPRSYIFLVIETLRKITGLGLARGETVLDQTANSDSFVEVSGILKAHASNIRKISGDLRLLNLLGEISLPVLQAGSSIMPGKVNPVVLEAAAQAGIKVISNDMIITEACSSATLQINEFMPLLAQALLESLDILINVNRIMSLHVSGINADEKKCRWYFDRSPAIITALLPQIGYHKAQELLDEFKASQREDLRVFLSEKLGEGLVNKVFSSHNLIALGHSAHGKNT